MSKFFSFLNHNLAKIIWMFAILVWVVVGIYYFSTNEVSLNFRSLVSSKPSVAPTPTPSENFDEIESIEGNFESWEEIEGSPDRYLVLINSQTEQFFPKARVGFEFSPLFGYKESKDATVFAVSKNDNDYDVLGYFQDFTVEEVDKIIKKGDFVKVILKRKIIEETGDDYQDLSTKNLKDANGNLLAHWLFIKREGGKVDIEKELGREVKSYE